MVHGNSLSGECRGVWRNLWWERVGTRAGEVTLADELLRDLIRANLSLRLLSEPNSASFLSSIGCSKPRSRRVDASPDERIARATKS